MTRQDRLDNLAQAALRAWRGKLNAAQDHVAYRAFQRAASAAARYRDEQITKEQAAARQDRR